MNILVTGGAGFIGSNFIFYMLDNHPDYRIVCLDALTYAGNLETLDDVLEKDNFRFIKGDIRDREFIFDIFSEEDFDIVVNFAAESHVDRSIEEPEVFLKTNILGTQNLLNKAKKHWETAENKKQFLIPKGFAHGFLTLTDNVEVQYKVDEYYAPEYDRSVLFNDPELDVDWPIDKPILSEKDKKAPLLKDSDFNFKY